MRYFVVYKDPDQQEKIYHLNAPLVVGRSSSCHIVLEREGVSRRHCEFSLLESKVVIKDLDSTNGTYLNGTRIKEAVVQPGDRVVLGSCTLALLDEKTGVSPLSQPTQLLGQTTIETLIEADQADLPDLPVLKAVGLPEDALKALFHLTELVHATEDPTELLRETLQELMKLLGMDLGCAFHGESPLDLSTPTVMVNPSKSQNYQPSRSVLERVLKENVSVVAIDRTASSGLFKAPSLVQSGTACIVCVPLRTTDRVRGALYLSSLKGRSSPGKITLQLITAMASQVGLALENLAHLAVLKRDNQVLRSSADEAGNLVGSSKAINGIRRLIDKVAVTNATVLITGESGTGKELVARAVHQRSPRHERPMVSINCGAIPESTVESELFGHERGAFTGADGVHIGKFELASEGTLFLDEIGELALGTQVKLLRALEERRFYRLGGESLVHADVRFLAATNADLKAKVDRGEFRSDLLYRLKVFVIEMPPLREHPEDIPDLVQSLLMRLTGNRDFHVTAKGMEKLKAYEWPGNVRELRNVLEREMILADGPELSMENMFLLPPGGSGPVGHETPLREVEKAHILRVLRSTEWNKKAAAEILGIGRATLYDKIRQYDIQDRA
ncbi:MAG: sigma 54-interacting transcriptional regulator [Planctomycetes bacterium]|nr:sigma 54-interacting transcriptional regulator [Planctomycetota bacterium]